jgi:hypothetical protein
MTILLQLLKEFWLPALVAIAWSAVNFSASTDQTWSWTRLINIAAPTFFFVSWLTSQYFRVKKQEHVSTTLETIERRVESVMSEVEQQARGLKYLADAQVVQTFDECIDRFREAREEIADRSRQVKAGESLDPGIFLLNRDNPFYPARRYLHQLVKYALHTTAIGREVDLEKRFSLTATHIEELAGTIGNFIGRMNKAGILWKTPRSIGLIDSICTEIELFRDELVVHSKYGAQTYKGDQIYSGLVATHLSHLRSLI